MSQNENDLIENYLKFIVNREMLRDQLEELKDLSRRNEQLKELWKRIKFSTSEMIDANEYLAGDRMEEARILDRLYYSPELLRSRIANNAKTDE